MEEELPIIIDINEEDRPSVRERKSRDCGYTGLTILYRLHKLYGFDIFNDLVVDTMHNIPMNVISAQLKYLISSEGFNQKTVDERLSTFPWTAGYYTINLYFKLSS